MKSKMLSKYRTAQSFRKYRDEFNEDYGVVEQWVVKTILTREIKRIDFGADYQYMTYKGQVRAYMTKRKRRNNKSLILKGDNFEMECLPEHWNEIEIEDNCISVLNAGLYITFKESLFYDYEQIERTLSYNKED